MLAFAAWIGYYVISGLPNLSLRVFAPTAALHALTASAIIAYLLYLSFRRLLPARPSSTGHLRLLLATASPPLPPSTGG
jgi:hypothetical protein